MSAPRDENRTIGEGEGTPAPADPSRSPATPDAVRAVETVQFQAGPAAAPVPATQVDATRSAAPASLDVDVPEELHKHPRYKITRVLGGGGMGIVYEAEHRLMDRPVALKVIHPRYLAHPAAVERFQREYRLAARLHHPNIVTAFDADQAGSRHFLVMEFVKGQTLADYLKQQGKLELAEACDIIRQAALGLEHAHQFGMVHRDIKPDNLMRTERGEIKILDFGLARFAQEQVLEASTAAEIERAQAAATEPAAAETDPTQLTIAGSVMGTPDYMAPEQVKDTHAADIRSDIYALGCTLFQLLTGQVLFPEGKVDEKLQQHVDTAPRPLRQLRPDVPAGLAQVLDKMLAKDPAQRYQTPGEVAQALAPLAKGDDPRRRRRRRMLAALALLLVLVGVAAYMVYWQLTNYGTLEAEAETPATLIVRRVGSGDETPWRLRLADQRGELHLPPGDYTLSLGEDTHGLRLLRDQVTIVRGEKTAVVLVKVAREDDVWAAFPLPDSKALAARLSPLDPLPLVVLPDYLGELRLKPPLELVAVLGGPAFRLSGPGTAPSFSADSKLVAVGSGVDILLMEIETGRVRQVFRGHTEPVEAVALSPDGNWLASAAADRTVRLWSVPKNAEVKSWFRNWGAVAFSPDSKTLAFDQSPLLLLHDLETGNTRELSMGGQASSLAFHDREMLAIGLMRGTILLYSLTDNAFHPEPPAFKNAEGKALVAFSAAGRLAIGNSVETMVFHPPDGKAPLKLAWHFEQPGDGLLAFAPDQRWLYAAAHTHATRTLPFNAVKRDIVTGKNSETILLAPWSGKGAFRLSPTGRWIAGFIGYDGRTLITHDLTGHLPSAAAEGHVAPVLGLAFLPDGQLVSCGADRTLRLWDLKTLTPIRSWPTVAAAEGPTVSPDGKRLALTCADQTIRIWDPVEGLKKTLRLPGVALRCVFDGEGKVLFVAGQDGKIVSFDADSGKDLSAYATTSLDVEGIVLDRSSKVLAAAGAKGQIHVWDVASARQLRLLAGHSTDSFPEPTGVHALLGSPDNRLLISTGRDGTVRIWDWKDGTRLDVLYGLNGEGRCLALGPDARVLAAGSSDGQIVLWDLKASPKRRFTLRESQKFKDSPINALAFSAEGRYLAAGLSDGSIHLYRLAARGATPVLADARPGLRWQATVPAPDQRIDLALFPDNERALSAHRDGTLRVWNVETGKSTAADRVHRAAALHLALATDGSTAWTTHVDAKAGGPSLARWDMNRLGGPDIMPLPGTPLALNARGEVVVRRKAGALTLLDHGGKEIWSLPEDIDGGLVRLSADGAWMLVGADTGAWLLDVKNRKVVRQLLTDPDVAARAAFSADGKRVAWLGPQQTIIVLELTADKELLRLPLPASSVQEMEFSSDGRFLVLGLREGQLALVEVTTGQTGWLRTVPMAHARFSADGRRLLTSHLAGDARLWLTPP